MDEKMLLAYNATTFDAQPFFEFFDKMLRDLVKRLGRNRKQLFEALDLLQEII
jgi:hypothetical protein